MPDINVNKLSEALNTKADIDLNNTGVFSTSSGVVNLTSSTPADANGKEVTSADFIKSNLLNYMTNRILEIPQDIKLELNNGVLTLKAGSKVYIPNGKNNDNSNKFDVVTIENDIEVLSNNSTPFIYYNAPTGVVTFDTTIYSGTTFPSNPITAQKFYKIDENYIYRFDGTNWNKHSYSLSLGFCKKATGSNNVISIEQVFNGFGYIGSTIFALPGIKCLVGNGRNPDGSCITKIEEITKVNIYTINADRQNHKIVLYNSKLDVRGSLWFDEQANMCYNNIPVVSAYQPTAILGTFSTENTSPWNIKEFNPLGVDSLANSNASNFSKAGESYLSGLGMPSNKYIDLTLGATGATYTAPANGWLFLDKAAVSGQYIEFIIGDNNNILYYEYAHANGDESIQLFIPIEKGRICKVNYTAGKTFAYRFIYAKGEQ